MVGYLREERYSIGYSIMITQNTYWMKKEKKTAAYRCPSKMVSHMVHIKIIKKYNSLFRCINPLHLNNE